MAPPRKCDCGVCRLCQRRVYLRGYYRRKQVEQAKALNGNGNGHVNGFRPLTRDDLKDGETRAKLRALIDEATRAKLETW